MGVVKSIGTRFIEQYREIIYQLSLPTYPFSSDRHWFLNSAQEEKQSNGDIYTFLQRDFKLEKCSYQQGIYR